MQIWPMTERRNVLTFGDSSLYGFSSTSPSPRRRYTWSLNAQPMRSTAAMASDAGMLQSKHSTDYSLRRIDKNLEMNPLDFRLIAALRGLFESTDMCQSSHKYLSSSHSRPKPSIRHHPGIIARNGIFYRIYPSHLLSRMLGFC